MYHDNYASLWGMQFFDGTNKKIYESAEKSGLNGYKHEIILKKGERIIGFKSRKDNDAYAFHQNF